MHINNNHNDDKARTRAGCGRGFTAAWGSSGSSWRPLATHVFVPVTVTPISCSRNLKVRGHDLSQFLC